MEQLRLSRETQEMVRRLVEATETIARELKRYNDREEEPGNGE